MKFGRAGRTCGFRSGGPTRGPLHREPGIGAGHSHVCFSATASFAAGAILTPLGGYTLARSYRRDRRYLVVSSFPLVFGIQQAVEGWGWLAIGSGGRLDEHSAAVAFLFFAYFLWPLLVPLSAYFIEQERRRRALFVTLSILGGLFGLSLYVPLLLSADWLSVRVVQGSIFYQSTLIYDGFMPRTVLRLFYAAIVALPLLISTVASIRLFGALILASVISGLVLFDYAFTSVWCFIAAILSIYVLRIVQRVPN